MDLGEKEQEEVQQDNGKSKPIPPTTHPKEDKTIVLYKALNHYIRPIPFSGCPM